MDKKQLIRLLDEAIALVDKLSELQIANGKILAEHSARKKAA